MPRLVVRCTHLCRCRTRTFVAQAANVLLDAHGNAKVADFGKLRVLLGLVDRDRSLFSVVTRRHGAGGRPAGHLGECPLDARFDQGIRRAPMCCSFRPMPPSTAPPLISPAPTPPPTLPPLSPQVIVGTQFYMSPEYASHGFVSEKIDSYGKNRIGGSALMHTVGKLAPGPSLSGLLRPASCPPKWPPGAGAAVPVCHTRRRSCVRSGVCGIGIIRDSHMLLSPYSPRMQPSRSSCWSC